MTAKKTYESRLKILKNQLKQIEKALQKHKKKFDKNDKSWGMAGDLKFVTDSLSQLDDFVKSNK